MPSAPLSPAVVAAVLLYCNRLYREYKLPRPCSADELIKAIGVSRSQAYSLSHAVGEALRGLVRPVGRPQSQPTVIDDSNERDDSLAIRGAVIEYMQDHPGCVSGTRRRRYTDDYRKFIVALRERYPSMEMTIFARAVCISEETLKPWLRTQARFLDEKEMETKPIEANGRVEADEHTDGEISAANVQSSGPGATDVRAENMTNDPTLESRLKTIIAEWRVWAGAFTVFCEHVKANCRIPYGRTMLSGILESSGERPIKKRPGRSPDELALRGSFETFFPGAQWVGDGMEVIVTINGEKFRYNFEALTDAASGARVGASVRDSEDSQAVIQAMDDAVTTTGDRPVAILLDNRSSNHTQEVQNALGDTLLIRSSPGRAQNKAHAEGTFGLFQQTMPPLDIWATNHRELGKAILALVIQVWGRTANFLPKKGSDGRSRVETYLQDTPTPEQQQQAREALAQRQRHQEKVYRTLHARQNPTTLAFLRQVFDELQLIDPTGNVLSAIARYPLGAIVDGVATFKAKKKAGTLPDGVDARYLCGIVRNIVCRNESMYLIQELLQTRLRLRDSFLDELVCQRDALICAELDCRELIAKSVEFAMDSKSSMDRVFWLVSIVQFIHRDLARLVDESQKQAQCQALARYACNQIRLTYRAPSTLRSEAIGYLLRSLFPHRLTPPVLADVRPDSSPLPIRRTPTLDAELFLCPFDSQWLRPTIACC